MIDKKVLKTYIIALVFTLITVGIPIVNTMFQEGYEDVVLFKFPALGSSCPQFLFFYVIALTVPYASIFIGYGLAYLVVSLYCKLSKHSKKIEFVGFSGIDRSKKYLRKKYIINLLFCILICLNMWVSMVTNRSFMELLITEEGLPYMYNGLTHEMYNFPMVAWYWFPIFVSVIIFSMCIVITDSGLVSVKRVAGQSNFYDTERVGDTIFGFVKGYAGISVILSFIALLSTEMGNEGSLVLYPFSAMTMLVHLIVAIDLFRNVGRKWIFKAVKSHYEPQMIEINFEKKDIADFNEILDKEEEENKEK